MLSIIFILCSPYLIYTPLRHFLIFLRKLAQSAAHIFTLCIPYVIYTPHTSLFVAFLKKLAQSSGHMFSTPQPLYNLYTRRHYL